MSDTGAVDTNELQDGVAEAGDSAVDPDTRADSSTTDDGVADVASDVADTRPDAFDGGGGEPCSPATGCWTTTLIGTGSLNRAYGDKDGNLYVGSGTGYFTNKTGTWTHTLLNSAVWTIDRDGVAHTLLTDPAPPTNGSGLRHAKWVGGAWVYASIPNNEPSGCEWYARPGVSKGDLAVGPDGTPHATWTRDAGCGSPGSWSYVSHSVGASTGWVTTRSLGGQPEEVFGETSVVTVDEAGHFHAAYVQSDTRCPSWFTPRPGGGGDTKLCGVGDMNDFPSKPELAIAAQKGATYVAFSARLPSAVTMTTPPTLVRQFVVAKGTEALTRLSCENEASTEHAVAADAAGSAHVAWIGRRFPESGAEVPLGAFYATNASGKWVTFRVDATATAIGVAVTPSGAVNLFVQKGSQLYRMTRC